MAFSSPLVSLWNGKEEIMTNRDRVIEEAHETIEASKDVYDIEALKSTWLISIAIELAGLNDELHALNLKIDKLTREVGKRK